MTLVVADRNPIDRAGLALLLATQPDFRVVGEAASGPETVARCQVFAPDVLLLDTHLLDGEGASLIADVRHDAPATAVIVLASRNEDRCVILDLARRRAAMPTKPRDEVAASAPSGLRTVVPRSPATGAHAASPDCSSGTDCLTLGVLSGARGAIRRSAMPETLFRAVRELASGNAWLEPGTAARLHQPRNVTAPLTERERDVAALVACGQSNKEIGQALGISDATVKRHIGHLFAKLGVIDRLQLGLHLARNPQLIAPPGARSTRTGSS